MKRTLTEYIRSLSVEELERIKKVVEQELEKRGKQACKMEN